MENKIQQLTEKLYSEGVQKGKSESDRMIEQAKNEAAKIISDAQKEAEKIIADATAKEAELATNTHKELVLAGNQMINDVKLSIRETLLKETLAEELQSKFNNPSFLASLIEQLVANWAKAGNIEVPASYEEEISQYLRDKLGEELSKNLVIRPSAKVKDGFRVEMEEGRYYINFGKDEFQAFLSDYLRAKVANIIFGEE